MRLAETITLYGGGAGSGPNAPCPQCGPKGGSKHADNVAKFKESIQQQSKPQPGYSIKDPKVKTLPPGQGTSKVPVGKLPVKPALSPKEEKEGKTIKGPKGKPSPETVVNPLGTHGLLKPGKHQMAPAPKGHYWEKELIEKNPPKSGAEDMQRWKQLTAKEKAEHNPQGIEEADKVILKAPVQGWEQKKGSGGMRTFPAGFAGQVMQLAYGIPPNLAGAKTSGLEPMAVVKLGKYGDPTYVRLSQLQLLEKSEINRPQIDVADVKKGKIVTQATTADGARYTIVKPSNAPDMDDNRGRFKEHGLAGRFQAVTGIVKDISDSNVRRQVFFAQPKGADQPKWIKDASLVARDPADVFRKGLGLSKLSKDPKYAERQLGAAGCTIFVERRYDLKPEVDKDTGEKTWPKTMRIQEINTGQWGHVHMMSRTWDYTNVKAAANFLDRRYEIKSPLTKSKKK